VFLEKSGPLYLEPADLHASAVAALQAMYPDHASFAALADKVGLHRAIEDTPKVWTKIRILRSLLQFDSGSYVWMKDKGPGQVVEVNMELESFKIEIVDLPALRVGFAAAAKLLQPLSESHIERRKLEDLPALLELKASEPGELLLITLQSHVDPMTTADIRKALTGIVEESEWKSFWSASKKHPQVLASTARGRQTYTWAASEDHALEDVRQRFEEAEVGEQLEILRKNAARDGQLKSEMIAVLQTLAQDSLESEPVTSLKIWYALDKMNSTAELSWSPSAIIRQSRDPVSLVASLADKTIRDRIYALLREELENWPTLYKRAIGNESDARLLSTLADHLGAVEPDALRSAIDDILGHPKRHTAAFVWLAESGDTYPSLTERNPLRLIRQILDAFHQSEFSGYRSRIHKTFETGGGATHLFARLSEEQAAQAERAIQRAPLDDHLRDSLVRYLHVRYPALDSSREASLYATREVIETRRQELEKLKLEEIPANRKAIEEARELGDLRENFEYKSARQRHEYLNARLASLQSDLSRVQPIALDRVDFSEARVGCRVELRNAAGESRSITVLGPWESDPDRHIVSYDSELGQNLLGKKPGDTLSLDNQSWDVESVGPVET
jgi:transcription elongation GreA/GreB family factor